MTYYIPYAATTPGNVELIALKIIRMGLSCSIREMGAGYILEICK